MDDITCMHLNVTCKAAFTKLLIQDENVTELITRSVIVLPATEANSAGSLFLLFLCLFNDDDVKEKSVDHSGS